MCSLLRDIPCPVYLFSLVVCFCSSKARSSGLRVIQLKPRTALQRAFDARRLSPRTFFAQRDAFLLEIVRPVFVRERSVTVMLTPGWLHLWRL